MTTLTHRRLLEFHSVLSPSGQRELERFADEYELGTSIEFEDGRWHENKIRLTLSSMFMDATKYCFHRL